MSWLRLAVSRAVEASGKNNLTRTVRSYAGNVVLQAGQVVAGGAKRLQDRMGVRNYQSFKVSIKSLEEIAVSCRGLERIQLLRRWLVALKVTERTDNTSTDDDNQEGVSSLAENNLSSRNDSMALHFDPGFGCESMAFRDVFLHSQALEGIILSMILEPPGEEEVSLLLELFGLCLTGRKDKHSAILSSIQDLGKSFANYEDEVLAKREELLQFAQAAIAGLKISADAMRIDAEASPLRERIDRMVESIASTSEISSKGTEKPTPITLESAKELLTEVQLCSRLKEMLLEKKLISNGDSPEARHDKVDKLKVLAESLANSSLKAERRIADHRRQKEEAIDFRVAKAKEVNIIEKELNTEISELEKQRDELEALLKKVNTSLTAAKIRLKKTREERDQFDEASNQLLIHLKYKEEDLTKSIASCKVEADVVQTWASFLQDTWCLQSAYTEEKEKQTNVELEKYSKNLVKLASHHISMIKEDLGPSVNRLRTFGYNLKNLRRSDSIPNTDGGSQTEQNPRKFLEPEYLQAEAKVVATFGVIDSVIELLSEGDAAGEDKEHIDQLVNDIEKLRKEFQSLERPVLDVESPPQQTSSPVASKPPKSAFAEKTRRLLLVKSGKTPKPNGPSIEAQMDSEAALEKLSDFGSPNRPEDIAGWEFDEF